jgi:hypothetical protein
MEKMVICKACKAEFPKSNKKCPNCGKKRKSSVGRVIAVVCIGFVFITILGNVIARSNKDKPATATQSTEVKTITREDYTKTGKAMVYREALLKDYKENDLLIFSGKVFQKVNDTEYLIDTKNTDFGYAGNKVYLTFNTEQKIIVGDVIKVYGKYKGTEKYTAVFGVDNEVPKVQGDFTDVLQAE